MEEQNERTGLFSISDFAEFARTTKDALVHYDDIGLLPPSSRGKNKYRYYSGDQLASLNVIRTLQDLGMSLNDIKSVKDCRTPENMNELFSKQMLLIDKKVEEWVRSRKLLSTLQGIIRTGLNIDEKAISIQFLPAEPIVLGGLNDYSHGKNSYDALRSFYYSMSESHPDLNLNYPVWGTFSAERIQNNDWKGPDRYYFYNPDGYDMRPAALYAIGSMRTTYGNCDTLYKRIIAYIDENGFEICGNAYEEYLLNEVSIVDENNYLVRVMITVREKQS